jgi:restriction endonuclease Mrr
MAIPKYHEFMKPVLELLKDNQVHKRVDMYKVLAIQFQLTEEELGMSTQNCTTFLRSATRTIAWLCLTG